VNQHSAPSCQHTAEERHSLRCMRADLSRTVEPGDVLAGVAIAELGVARVHHLLVTGGPATAQELERVSIAAASDGLGPRQRRLADGLARWRTRLEQTDGERDIHRMAALGGGILIPEDPEWPAAMNDLGRAAPVALWYRGSPSGPRVRSTPDTPSMLSALPSAPAAGLTSAAHLPAHHRSVAIVGSREISDYGRRVAAEFAGELSLHGISVISGGAYGVDAMAHRAALRAGTAPTYAVLAGGLDRWYPAGNEALLRDIAGQGLILSEMPLGAAPTRHRFLQRNRLIAALAAATVVVEARWRSGAQNTAHHALNLDRPVAVVPGSVHSPTSAGCHRLLKETPAALVVDAADVVELIAAAGADSATGSAEGAHRRPARTPGPVLEALPIPSSGPQAESGSAGTIGLYDTLSDVDKRVFDALPLRQLSSPSKLSAVSGLPVPQLLSGLTRLERIGLARAVNNQWGRQRE
jgi:DNA processing protein